MSEFDRIANTEDVPAVLADSRGAITYINDCFVRTFGWNPEDLVGKLLTVIMPAHFEDAHNMGLSRFLSTEQQTILGQALDLEIVAKDGQVLKTRHFIIAEQRGGEWAFAATIRKPE